MTRQQINKLITDGVFPGFAGNPALIETHISWVIICQEFAYKIKRPACYSFLDFSTRELREYYCNRELELNRRFSDDIYICVLPVKESNGKFFIGDGTGETVDYAVCMKKMDRNKQMDHLLTAGLVTRQDMERLAKKIAGFHASTVIVHEKDCLDVPCLFNDLRAQEGYIRASVSNEAALLMIRAMDIAAVFAETNKHVFKDRLRNGFFRDCHGDLHSRNIFLLPAPEPFDCIEFNNDLRQIDLLNEVAFLCMDLDAFERKDLSDFFIDCYNKLFPVIFSEEERKLFIYYKSYRANIRAKVNILRAKSANSQKEKAQALAEAQKYLLLMDSYIRQL